MSDLPSQRVSSASSSAWFRRDGLDSKATSGLFEELLRLPNFTSPEAKPSTVNPVSDRPKDESSGDSNADESTVSDSTSGSTDRATAASCYAYVPIAQNRSIVHSKTEQVVSDKRHTTPNKNEKLPNQQSGDSLSKNPSKHPAKVTSASATSSEGKVILTSGSSVQTSEKLVPGAEAGIAGNIQDQVAIESSNAIESRISNSGKKSKTSNDIQLPIRTIDSQPIPHEINSQLATAKLNTAVNQEEVAGRDHSHELVRTKPSSHATGSAKAASQSHQSVKESTLEQQQQQQQNEDVPGLNRNRRQERLTERANGSARRSTNNTNDESRREDKDKPTQASALAHTGAAFENSVTTTLTQSAVNSLDTQQESVTNNIIGALPVSTTPISATISTVIEVSAQASSVNTPIVSSASSTTSSNATIAASSTFGGSVGIAPTSSRPASDQAPVARSSGLTTYQESKLVQRVLRSFERLGTSGGQIRMRLHPPELGSLQVTMRIEAGQMSAHLEVENTRARDALVQNVQVLRDRLSEQGIQVQQFEVQVGSQDSSSNPQWYSGDGQGSSDSQQDRSQNRFAAQNANRLPANPSTRIEGTTIVNRNAALDLKV